MKDVIFDSKQRRIIFMLAYVFIACIVIYIFSPTYTVSLFLVIVPPSLANFFWLKRSKKKIFLLSILSLILFAPPVEIMTRLTDSWDVQSILPRPFGLIPIENMLFAFFNILWPLSFYEYFVDKDRIIVISKRLKYLVGLYCLLALIVYTIFFLNKELIAVRYLVAAIPILIIPSLIIFSKNPHILKKVLLTTVFFAIVHFTFEFFAMQIGNWWWPSDYLYTFNLAGKIYPLDDAIVWFLLSTPALIGGYEFFVDDNK
ncbi:MAG: hypothetical protein PHS44_06930 [Candidatus Dojkabacteria bacterium]|jgi:hypothetical protein|nr:hypothetical protein [Candidatus Dojkabacteria bacterium]